MKLKTTNRKFYNKWLYKVSLRLNGAGVFRLYDLDTVIKNVSSKNSKDVPSWLLDKASLNVDTIVDVCNALKKYDPSIWSKRIERNNLDLYSNDPTFFRDFVDNFESVIRTAFEPNGNSKDLLENDGTIVGKKLPHGRYQYRVYLLPHKLAHRNEDKQRVLDWIKSQDGRITCTSSVENWFLQTNWNRDRRYVLVEDEKTLLMLKLRNADIVGKIYKYVVCDK